MNTAVPVGTRAVRHMEEAEEVKSAGAAVVEDAERGLKASPFGAARARGHPACLSPGEAAVAVETGAAAGSVVAAVVVGSGMAAAVATASASQSEDQ